MRRLASMVDGDPGRFALGQAGGRWTECAQNAHCGVRFIPSYEKPRRGLMGENPPFPKRGGRCRFRYGERIAQMVEFCEPGRRDRCIARGGRISQKPAPQARSPQPKQPMCVPIGNAPILKCASCTPYWVRAGGTATTQLLYSLEKSRYQAGFRLGLVDIGLNCDLSSSYD